MLDDVEEPALFDLELGGKPVIDHDEDLALSEARLPPDSLFGNDLFGDPIKQETTGRLSERFIIPPFTVLDGRSAVWGERKRAWKSLGIKSEEGRDDELVFSKSLTGPGYNNFGELHQTSIFDPVLCELFYTWFCPPGGQILDPFAGGSVRGIVATFLGFKYWGADLSQRQVAANRANAAEIVPDRPPVWECGDSMEILDHSPEADLIFSCPPYGDLEKYSDDPRDLSTLSQNQFFTNYRMIIKGCYAMLKPHRFAIFTVGDYRDKNGNYVNFIGKTVEAFEAAGFTFYNEAITLNMLGTAAVRASAHFDRGRKLVKTHQNVLVFLKGDSKLAVQACIPK